MIIRLFTSRPVKVLLVLFVLAAAVSQAVPYIVDAKPFVDKIATTVRQETGATLMVKGGSHIQVIPRPALILKSVEINQPDAPGTPTFTADATEIGISVPSLLTSDPQVNAIRSAGISVIVEQQPNGDAQWGFMGLPLLKKLASLKPAHDIKLELYGGNIAVAGQAAAPDSISNLSVSGTIGERTNVSGSLDSRGRTIQFAATRDGLIGATPISLTLNTQNGSMMSLKGSMDFTANYPVVTGRFEANVIDITGFGAPLQVAENKSEEGKPLQEPIPLKMTADYVQKEEVIALSNMNIEALNSKATGMFEWGRQHSLNLNFSVLDMVGARTLFSMLMVPKVKAGESQMTKALIDQGFDMQIDVIADQVINGEQKWSNASFNGTVADGVLTVNQLNIALPGESKVSLFGLLSVSDTQGLRFEGNTEVQGKSLRELLTVFDESASNLPALGFGAYKLRSNLFISRELLRLSEADAEFSELSFKGGLVAYFDKRPRIEAEVGLRNINFDYFRDSWRNNTEHAPGDTVFLRFDRNMNFDWLKKLSATIDFKVNVQDFTFLERKGDMATFRLFAQSGEFGIYNAKFNYPTDITEANLKFDVNTTQPTLSLVLNTTELNTNYFALKAEAPMPVATPVVSKEDAKVEDLPEMSMPDATTAEDDLRQKIAEEANQLGITGEPGLAAPAPPPPAAAEPVAPPAVPEPLPPVMPPASATPTTPAAEGAPTIAPPSSMPVQILDPEKPESAMMPQGMEDITVEGADDMADPVELTPLTDPSDIQTDITTVPRSLIVSDAHAQVSAAPAPAPVAAGASIPLPVDRPGTAQASGRWSEAPIDMSLIEGINGSFDISIGKLQHKDLLFQNFKMLAKLERNLLNFQTLTFQHWGGSFSINGTIFGGKVPGLSLGFIIASADLQQMLGTLLNVDAIGGRASVSGVIDTSGVSMLSWVSQANAKMLFAGRGVSIQGFDVASIIPAVNASRTAADIFNNVNLSLVGGAGEYSADGAINLQNGTFSTPGVALKTGRIVGNITGDFRLIPWDMTLAGSFKFPELSTDNVPTLSVQWSGPVEKLALQTDTQSLEAFVSKRIIGN